MCTDTMKSQNNWVMAGVYGCIITVAIAGPISLFRSRGDHESIVYATKIFGVMAFVIGIIVEMAYFAWRQTRLIDSTPMYKVIIPVHILWCIGVISFTYGLSDNSIPFGALFLITVALIQATLHLRFFKPKG